MGYPHEKGSYSNSLFHWAPRHVDCIADEKVPGARALMTRSLFSLVKAISLLCALTCCGPGAAAISSGQAACAAKLQAIEPGDPAFKRLDKIYRQSLRFGGTVHRIIPHFHSTYEDLLAAKNRMSAEDIPYMVYELARADEPNARQRVAVGVLGLFGEQALPCIEAAMLDPGIKGRFTLNQIRIHIGVERASTPRAQ